MQKISPEVSNRLHTIRALFTLFVVGIHTTPAELKNQGSLLFSVSILLDALYRTAVPGFFLLTGYLLVHEAEPSLQFYRTRFGRILPAWFFWSLIYLAYRVAFLDNRISLPSAVRCLITGETYYHLWFMYRIAGIYLVLPVISLLTVRASSMIAFSAIALAFALNQLAPDLGNLATFLTGHSFQPAISYPLNDSLLLFVIAGGLLRSWTDTGGFRKISIWTFLSAYAMLSIFSLWRSFRIGQLDESVYVGSLITPMALSFFAASLHLLRGHDLNPVLRAASDASFGIYLAHPLIHHALQSMPLILLSDIIPGWNTTVVFLTSLMAVHVLRRSKACVFLHDCDRKE